MEKLSPVPWTPIPSVMLFLRSQENHFFQLRSNREKKQIGSLWWSCQCSKNRGLLRATCLVDVQWRSHDAVTENLERTNKDPVFENALEDVIARVEDGETLSDAFARHPKIFSDMAVNMSRAGAEGGFLEDALQRVASFTEQQDELKSRTIGALIYPAVWQRSAPLCRRAHCLFRSKIWSNV